MSKGSQVCFGDYVLICGNKLKKPSKDQKEAIKIKGLMNAQGFGQNNVYLESTNIDITDESNKQIHLLKNYKDCVFQIWPKLDYEAHKELEKLMKIKTMMEKQKQQDEDIVADEEQKKQQEQYYQNALDKIKKIKLRCESEKENNFNLINQFKGRPVSYAQDIFLMHLNSKSFLNGKPSVSETDQAAYRFELSLQFRRGMGFRIIPRYKLRQEGEAIQFRDNILLLNVKLNCYVNFNTNQMIQLDKPLPAIGSSKSQIKKVDLQRNEGRARYECFVSSLSDTNWQLIYFRSAEEKESYNIMGHDLIQLKHTETQGLLSADYNYRVDGGLAECYIRVYGGKREEERDSLFSIWEIETTENYIRGQDLILSSKQTDPKTGKVIMDHKQFLLRHFLTGKVMMCQQSTIDGKPRMVLCLPNNDSQLQQNPFSMQFISMAGEDKEMIENNICYLIANKDLQLYTDTTVKYNMDVKEGVKGGKKHAVPPQNYKKFSDVSEESIYQPLRDSDFECTRYGVMCEDKGTREENAFQLQRVDQKLAEQLYSIQTQMSIILRYCNMIKSKQSEVITNKELIRSVQGALTYIIFFVGKSSLEPSVNNALISEGVPIRLNQRLIRDFRLIDILTDILFYVFKYEIVLLEKVGDQNEEVIKIFQLVYKCIMVSIKDYAPNELYASQWIDLMIIQSKLADEQNNIGAEETLTELIDNNRLILETKISIETIKQFIAMLLNEKTYKYVKLLYALIVCYNQPMVENQATISQQLLGNNEYLDQLIYPLTEVENQIMIKPYKDEAQILLLDFKNVSENKDELKNYNFFLGMLSLYSGLCLGRNYLALEILEQLYPYQICYRVISDNKYDLQLRRKMINLMIHLWIDRAPYFKLVLPDRIRVWDEIDYFNDSTLPKTSQNILKFIPFKKFILDQLNYNCSIGYNRVFDKNENEFLLEIINLMRTFMSFGFYQETTEVQQIIGPLIKLLVSAYDVCDIDEENAIIALFERRSKAKCQQKKSSSNKQKRFLTRYQESDVNIITHRIKEAICESLINLRNIITSSQISDILLQFKKERLGVEFRKNNKKKPSFWDAFISPSEEELCLIEYSEQFKIQPLKWIKKLMDHKKIKYESKYETKLESKQEQAQSVDITLALLDLTLYKYDRLVNVSFDFIISQFKQQINLVQSIKEIQLLEDSQQVRAFKKLEEISIGLIQIVEKSEIWMWSNDKKNLDQTIKALDYLNQIADILLSSKQQQEEEYDLSIQQQIPQVSQLFGYGGSVNTFAQDLLRNNKIYEHLISLLKFDVEKFTLRRELEQGDQFISNSNVTHKLLRVCYLILARFIYNCQENQTLIHQYLENVFLIHLKHMPDLDLHILLEQLFQNNRALLMNDQLVFRILQVIISTIDRAPITSPIKPSYMQCLTQLTKINDRVSKQNQTLMINEITHRNYNNVLLNYDDMNLFTQEITALQKSMQKGIQEIVKIPNKLDYFNTYITIMATICEDKNNATESKTQNYFPLQVVSKMLETTKDCWYIKKNIMFFVYHVYLQTERDISDDLNIERKNLIVSFKNDLQSISETLQQNNMSMLTYRGIVSSKQIKEEYYYGSLLLCCETVIKKRMIDDHQERDEFLQALLNSLINMLDQNDAQNKKYQIIIQNMLSLLISIGITNEIDLQQKIGRKDFIPTQQLVAQTKRGEISLYSFTQENRIQSITINQEKLLKRMNDLLQHQDFQKNQKDEMNLLITCLSNIEENTHKEYKGACTIQYKDMLMAMINFTEKNSQINIGLTIQRLQIFIRILEQTNPECQKEIGEWESNDYQLVAKQILRQQNLMVELGLVRMLYKILQDDVNQELMNQTIYLSIGLLLGGNKQAQEAFYQQMQSDQTNQFLICLKDYLEKGFEQIKKLMSQINKKLFDQMVRGNQQSENDQLDIEDQELDEDELLEDGGQLLKTIDDEMRKQLQLITRVYRLLQLMCEGHNLTMQDFLRQQIIENQILGRNYDFVYNAGVQYQQLVKFINVHCVAFGEQLMDFMIESVQGPCNGNQQKLVASKAIETSKDFMNKFQSIGDYQQYGFKEVEQQKEISLLVVKSSKLLLGLIEGKYNEFVVTQMLQVLDFDLLFDRLKEKLQKFKQQYGIPEDEEDTDIIVSKLNKLFDEDIMEAYDLFLLIKQLKDSSTYLKEKFDQIESGDFEDQELTKTLKFFNGTVRSIEILFNGELIKVFFPIQPICRFLTRDTRVRLMNIIPRESPNEKIEGLQDEAQGVFDEIEHMERLNNFQFNFSQSRYNFLRDISTLISFAINLMMIFTYSQKLNPSNSTKQMNNDVIYSLPTPQIMNYLGYAQLLTSSLMLLFWVFIHTPLLLTNKWREFLAENQKEHEEEIFALDKYVDNEDFDPDELPVSITIKLLNLKGPEIPLFNRSIFKDFGNQYTRLLYFWKNFTFVFSESEVIYFFFYITVSFLGSLVSPIAYCLHLLDIINRFPTLQNVIKAITTNSSQLLLTTLLGIIMMYLWAIIAFFFLADGFTLDVALSFGANGLPFTQNVCTSLLQCFLTVVDQGLLQGGGVGDFLPVESFEPDNYPIYFVRYIYDVLFFMVVKMAFLNIIFGIIIDTFADLRDKRNKQEEDMNNVCFICGIDRDQFDQFADGFENHIERDHNLWNYLFYLYYLKNIDQTEYNGIQSYVIKKYNAEESSWFPLLRAMSIKEDNEDEDEEGKVNAELEAIKKSIHDAVEQVDRLQKQI